MASPIDFASEQSLTSLVMLRAIIVVNMGAETLARNCSYEPDGNRAEANLNRSNCSRDLDSPENIDLWQSTLNKLQIFLGVF